MLNQCVENLDWNKMESSDDQDYDGEDESGENSDDGRLFKETDYYFDQLKKGSKHRSNVQSSEDENAM